MAAVQAIAAVTEIEPAALWWDYTRVQILDQAEHRRLQAELDAFDDRDDVSGIEELENREARKVRLAARGRLIAALNRTFCYPRLPVDRPPPLMIDMASSVA